MSNSPEIDNLEKPWRNEEVLRRLYRDKGLTIIECAEKLGCGKSTIGNWLSRHDIPRWVGAESRTREEIVVTDKHHEIIKGLLMSDGNISYHNEKSTCLQVRMITREFLEWLDDQLGILSLGVSLKQTAEESAKEHRESGFNPNANPENYSDIYQLTTRAVPDLTIYRDWYTDIGKVWPKDIILTPTVLKMFFCGDGDKKVDHRESNRKPHIRFRADNELKNKQKVIDMFSNVGFDIMWTGKNIRVSVSESYRMWEYMGSPPPGFEYKWPISGQ